MAKIEIKQVEPEDEEVLEEWVRITEEEDLLGVSATRTADDKWPWRVWPHAAEFVREEPLQSQLFASITTALENVPGVKQAAQDDRECWVVQGHPSGENLVRAIAIALDSLAEPLRKFYSSHG